jgi:hypothetical protein
MINLNDFRRKISSQNAEDGITDKIFELIGVTNKFAVEIGAGNGNENCSRFLHDKRGFTGVMFDMNDEDIPRSLYKEFVTVDNVLALLEKHNVPACPDFLGVDIDSFDFYVCHKVLTKYRPRLLIVETNPTFLKDDKVVMLDHPCNGYWAYHGASLVAWFNSLNPLGYRLVCHEWNGINALFVLDGLIPAGTIANYNSMELFSAHEGKEGCSLANYKMYPPSYPILTSREALDILKLPPNTFVPQIAESSPYEKVQGEFLSLVARGAPMSAYRKFGIKTKDQFNRVYADIRSINERL